MKFLDIAIKDLTRSMRSAMALVFMFVVPLLVTGMFYFMFGSSSSEGEFDLPRTQVIVANLDDGGPRLRVGSGKISGGFTANTLSELVVEILQSEDLSDLLAVSLAPDAASARAAVDAQQAQVAVIIPADFGRQFADLYGQAEIEFYQDPTLTIGPGIVKSILNRFMDGLAGVKITADVAIDQVESSDPALVGQAIQAYLQTSMTQVEDLSAEMLAVSSPDPGSAPEAANPVVQMLGPIMGGMMIFYAFYTGTTAAQSILREEEERTLPRLFTTPTPQAAILGGKLLAVFLTVLVQVVVLLVAARFLFGINWGRFPAVALSAAGIILSASSFGIFVNSLLKDTKQSGVIFGGVLTVSGMLGMISIFAMNSPGAETLSNTVALLVPQGWAVRGLLQAMDGGAALEVLPAAVALLVWTAAFFAAGVWRFNRRYA